MRCYLCHTTLLFQNASHFHVTVIFLYRRYPNLVTSLQYKELKMILWDHQHSSYNLQGALMVNDHLDVYYRHEYANKITAP